MRGKERKKDYKEHKLDHNMSGTWKIMRAPNQKLFPICYYVVHFEQLYWFILFSSFVVFPIDPWTRI